MANVADPIETTGTMEPGEAPPGSTRDYLKALVLIAVVIGVVVLALWIAIASSCACTTPAGG